MIPTRIHCTLFLKGTDTKLSSDGMHLSLMAVEIDESLAIYLPGRDKEFDSDDDLPIDEHGMLTEDLFAITSIEEMETACCGDPHWLRDYMSNDGWSDLKQDAGNIYDVAKAHVDDWLKKHVPEKIEDFDGSPVPTVFPMSFIGLWQPHQSKGYFDEYPEIDSIDFIGEGRIVLIEPVKNPNPIPT